MSLLFGKNRAHENKKKIFRFLFVFVPLFFIFLFSHTSTAFASDRYWIGGTGNWSDTAHWSNADSGGGGFSVPTSADNVYFSAGSFSVNGAIVTIDTTANTANLDFSGITKTMTLTNTVNILNVYGNLILSTKLTWSANNNVAVLNIKTTTSMNFDTQGIQMSVGSNGAGIFFNGSGTYNLINNLILAGNPTIKVQSGTFNTNSYNINTSQLYFNGSSIINLGSSILTTVIYSADTTFTLNAGTSTLKSALSSAQYSFAGGNKNYYNIEYTGQTTGYISGFSSCNNFTFTTNGTALNLNLDSNLIINNNLTINGLNSTINRALINSKTIGTQRTITVDTAKVTASNVDFRDIKFQNAVDLSGISGGSGDAGGNTGITFTTAQPQYFKHTSGAVNWSDSTKWFSDASPRTTPGRVPLPQDDVYFDASSFTGTSTLTVNVPRIGRSLDMSAVNQTVTMTLANAIESYGNVYTGSGVNFTTSNYAIWLRSRQTYVYVSIANSLNNNLFWYAPTGIVTFLHDFTSTKNIGANAIWVDSSFDFNDFNITVNYFYVHGRVSGNITRNFGNGIITINTGYFYSSSIQGEGSRLRVLNSFSGSIDQNYFNIVELQSNSDIVIGQSNIAGWTNINELILTAGKTYRFTAKVVNNPYYNIGKLTAIGTALNPITITSITNANHTLNFTGTGNVVADYLNLSYSTATPANKWYAGINSTDGGNNSGWIFASAPNAPTGLTPTSGNNQVLLSWTAPANNGSPITDYVYEWEIHNSGTWNQVLHSPSANLFATIPNLTNGTSYDFRVSAYNAVGTGSPSATATATPATTPGKPTITNVARGNSGEVVATFSTPDNGGSEILDYTVTSSPDSHTVTGASSPLTVTGLTNGTPYTFTVRARNAVGQGTASDPSASITPATVPGAPTTVLATAQDRQVYLSWTAPEVTGGIPISDYIIDVKLHSAPDSDWATFSDGTSILTYATMNNLTNGLSYDFRVSATNFPDGPGQGVPSSPIVSSTPMTTPSAPTITGVVRGGSQEVVVSFSAPDNGGSAIIDYTVYNNVDANTVTASASPITFTGLTNGTPYTFTVKARNIVGQGSASGPSASITPATVPGVPTDLNAVRGNHSQEVDLTWTAPASGGSAIDNYVIEYEPINSPNTWLQFGHASSPATFITVTNLTNGLQYEFRVSAHNVAGTGGSSSTSNATPATVPGAPTINTATRGNAQVSVDFSTPADGGLPITGYTVTSNTGGHTGTGTSSPIIVSGLTNGTAYTFRVTATNAVGDGTASDPSGSVTPATVPGVPTAITPTAGDSHVDLSWTAPEVTGGSDIIDYVIEFEPSNAPGTWASVGHTASPATSIPVPNLTNGLQYDFRISAVNDVNKGEASSPVTATPVTVPGAPTIGTVIRGNSQEVVVNFTAPGSTGGSTILDYTVTSSPDSHTVTGTSSPLTVTGLTNGTPYTFTVRARNAVGQGTASDPSASITPATVPGVPTSVLVTVGNEQATVSFTAPGNGGSTITGYTVTSSAGTDSNAGSTNLSHLVTGLTKGATYTFSVTATNDVGTGSPAVSDPVTLPTEPGAPSNLATVVLGSSIKLTWSPVVSPADGGSAVTDYIVEYQKTTDGSWNVFEDGTSTDATATVTGLSDRTSYDFKVRANNIIGPGLFSDVVSATPGEPAQVRIQSFPDLTATTIGTEVLITNEGSVEYEYQYTWCVTDSETNLCGGGDDVFSSTAAKLIKSHEDYDTVLNSTVSIPGNYWFHIKVLYGSQFSVADQSFTVVATYPDPPTSVSTVAGNAQATITFTPPVNNGGSAITGYTVTSSPGGLTGTGSASPITVTGLTNGTNYTFKVNAINSVGTGLASDSSASVMPVTIPDPPTSISATSGNAQVTLSWVAPVITGGLPITDYIIEYKLSSASDFDWVAFLDAVSTATTATVTNLTNNLSYDFRVSAVNSFGRSGVDSASGLPAGTTPPRQGGGGSGSYIIYYTINVSAGANGSISPNGSRSLTYGGSQTYIITPITGYQVADVLVDSISQGAITTYAFNSITGGHTISATFSSIIATPTITPTPITPTTKTAPPKVNKVTPTVPSTETNKVSPVIIVPVPNVKIPGNKISAVPTAPSATPTLIVQTSGYWILWLLIAIFVVLILCGIFIFLVIRRRRKNKQE